MLINPVRKQCLRAHLNSFLDRKNRKELNAIWVHLSWRVWVLFYRVWSWNLMQTIHVPFLIMTIIMTIYHIPPNLMCWDEHRAPFKIKEKLPLTFWLSFFAPIKCVRFLAYYSITLGHDNRKVNLLHWQGKQGKLYIFGENLLEMGLTAKDSCFILHACREW